MTQLTLNRIRSVLEQQFSGKIDMSDYATKSPEDTKQAFLSRALAALCIKGLSGVDADVAGGTITDGFNDGGIDAIRFEPRTDTLFLVQSKWSDNGNKPIDPDGVGKFVAGIRDLLSCRFDRFNEKVKSKEAEIRTALYADRQIRIRLITIHSANQPDFRCMPITLWIQFIDRQARELPNRNVPADKEVARRGRLPQPR